MVETLHIVGAGRVGRVLGHLWAARGALQVAQVVNRSRSSAEHAIEFIGQGRAAAQARALQAADLVMISTSDAAIESVAAELAAAGWLSTETLVFHCSGAVGLEALRAAQQAGAQVARAHPLHSFAEPSRSVRAFPGTSCGVEGTGRALGVLKPLLRAIGGAPFRLPPSPCPQYHLGAVFASNYLAALLEASLRCYEQAGFSRPEASRLLRGLVTTTLDNVLQLGPAAALTGPIARGDARLVQEQLATLQVDQPDLADAYRALGALAVQLATERAGGRDERLRQLAALLQR